MLTELNSAELRTHERSVSSAKIIATGQAIPKANVSSEQIDARIETPKGWLKCFPSATMRQNG